MTTVPPLCGVVAALLQYFMLVFFGWTAVEAVFLYQKLVRKVLGQTSPRFVLKAAAIVWGKLTESSVCTMYTYNIYVTCILSWYCHMMFTYDDDLYTYAVVPAVIVGISAGAGHQFYINPF